MTGSVRDYARIGLVHHMLYPASTQDADHHAQTLKVFTKRPDIDTFDCCLPLHAASERDLVRAVTMSGKRDIAYATHLFPLRQLALTATADGEQGVIRTVIRDMVRQAAEIGASGFIFASGGPSPGHATDEHHASFRDFCRWLCGELAHHGIDALLEPFDTTVDKCFLYGSTERCVALIDSLRPDVTNFGIELDIAHLPLMGEDLDRAIRTVRAHLKRVHLGNCVLRDASHPRYGDTHPPIGYPGGEIDVPEVSAVLRALLDVGFLDKRKPGSLVVEMTPWPGKGIEETVSDAFRRLDQAWRHV